jgi:hypothetical protein
MEIIQVVLIWIFGSLTVGFLVISFISIFLHGSSLLWVSEKANEKHHQYMLYAGLCFVLWLMVASPENIKEALFCLLPMVLLYIGFSYFNSKLTRKGLKWLSSKTGIENPIEPKSKE